MKKIQVSKFEYDYLAAQRELDTQKVHMDAMIRRGYFKNLAPYFTHEDCGKSVRRSDGKLHYVLIGTIRDHINEFEITDGTTTNAEDFTPSEYITTCSDRKIVKNCIELMDGVVRAVAEYLDYIDVDKDGEIPFNYNISYFGLVQRLLLRGTNHEGGTSTREKCCELGLDYGESVTFTSWEDERFKEDEDDD